MSHRRCPECREPLELVKEYIPPTNGREEQEAEYWCLRCQEYFYDSDFYYTEEE